VIARRLGLLGAVALLALAGCTPVPPTIETQAWERVDLPGGFEARSCSRSTDAS
jgi:hypothetical protein